MRRNLITTILFLLVASVCGAALAQPRAGSSNDYKVIVHPENPIQEIDSRTLGDMFLKKLTAWPDGEPVHPVDLSARSPIREKFTKDVLDRTLFAVKSYWQQLLFSGRGLPPVELDSDEAVVRYVLERRGAVGYVSAKAQIGNAKLLAVR